MKSLYQTAISAAKSRLLGPRDTLTVALAEAEALRCRTRVEFTARILSEAVAFQVENLEHDGDPATDLEATDRDLDALIEMTRRAQTEEGTITAWVAAEELRRYLVVNGYAEDHELPVYWTR